jgi:gliding motility-associatede transport system auxiliary component
VARGALSMSLATYFNQSVRHTVLLAVQILMAAVLFGLLVVLADNHNRRFDLTPTKSFILSDEARHVAQSVTVPIKITAFYNSQDSEQRRQMEDLLQLFRDASPRISYRLLDLDRSPAMAKKYNVSSFNTGVIEADGQLRDLHSIDEEEVTNGLLKLTRREKRTLCFVTGHGEHSPNDPSDRSGYSEVAKALEKEHFEVHSLDTVPPQGVPTDCTVVIFAGPSRDLLPGEADQLSRYLERGGQILLMIDPKAPTSIVEFLAQHNVRAGNDIVVDERNRFYGADSFMPRVPIFDEGTFRKNLDTAAVFALARTVSPLDKEQGSPKVLLLALTSADSWAHIDGGVIPEGKVQFRREVDKPGPLPVAVMVTTAAATPPGQDSASAGGRMVVFGDSDFASNLYLNLLGNKDLFMSTVGVLAEDEALIAVRRKGLPRSSLSPVSLTERQGRMIFWSAVIMQPVGFACLGVLITWRRRRRASA